MGLLSYENWLLDAATRLVNSLIQPSFP